MPPPPVVVRLEDLDLFHIRQSVRSPQRNLNVKGNPLCIAGKGYANGLGAHAESYFRLRLGGKAKSFRVKVGMDDEGGFHWGSAIKFWLEGDGRILAQSRVLRRGDEPEELAADLTGIDTLTLVAAAAGFGIQGDYADWVDGDFELLEGALQALPVDIDSPEVLTPKPKPKPRLTGPTVFGARPGHPIRFAVTATGKRPMTFEADFLPGDLVLDPETGELAGTLHYPGEHQIEVTAKNVLGSAKRTLKLFVGADIALTPPMGWSSWNCWGWNVTQEHVKTSAEAMATKLRDHGWTYVNIDDTWQGTREGAWNAIQPNERFPDMKGLVETIHGLGLKAGIYSTPWKASYAGYLGGSADANHEDGLNPHSRSEAKIPPIGSEAERNRDKTQNPKSFGRVSFASNDIDQFAEWEFDFLKYDWNPIDVPHAEEAYQFLCTCGRDIVLSLSNSARIEDAEGLSACSQMWRTSGDLSDTWGTIKANAFGHAQWTPHQRPGHWADEDMLVIGRVSLGDEMHDCRLTPNEQYLHVTQWCLLGSPLLIGCDLTSLDAFTLGLLTNDEVLGVNQDPLGAMAGPVRQSDAEQVWVKLLEDGSLAVGLYNTSEDPREVAVSWEELGIRGKQMVRDLWRQKNLGKFADSFSATIGRHGAALVRIAGPI